MLNLSRFIFSLLGFFTLIISNIFSQNVQYISPYPKSCYNMENTNIIIGYDSELNKSNIHLNVYGTLSGFHWGRIIFTSNNRKLLFQPYTPFVLGETVYVSGYNYNEFFYFYVRKSVPGYDKEKISDRISFELNQNTISRNINNSTSPSPDSVPHFVINKYGDTSPGNIFISNFTGSLSNQAFLLILDDFGNSVYTKPLVNRAYDFKKQNNYFTYYDESYHSYLAMDSSYTIVDTFHCGNGYSTDFHECFLEPDNSAWLLCYDEQYIDMSVIVPGGFSYALVTGIVIQKIDSAKNVVFQWRSWDHIPITDATHENLLTSIIDYMHTNSIDVDYDGNIIISSRHLDEITKIDVTTGDIIWRFGGKQNQFSFINDTAKFSHQHSARRLSNKNILLFDNGNYHSPQYSRAAEYRLDEQDKKAELVWEYKSSPSIFSTAMGSVQRLLNGNTLIGWGTAARTLSEVSPNGTLLYTLSLPAGQNSYRAFRFNLNSVITNTGYNSAAIPEKFTLLQNFPNPFNPSTNINYAIPKGSNVKLTVFNLLGQEIATIVNKFQNAGSYSIKFDAGNLTSGIYFYKLEAGDFVEVKKMCLIR